MQYYGTQFSGNNFYGSPPGAFSPASGLGIFNSPVLGESQILSDLFGGPVTSGLNQGASLEAIIQQIDYNLEQYGQFIAYQQQAQGHSPYGQRPLNNQPPARVDVLPGTDEPNKNDATAPENQNQTDQNTKAADSDANDVQVQQIQNVFANREFIRRLRNNPDEFDNSTFTRGLDEDDLTQAAIRHYSMPTLYRLLAAENAEAAEAEIRAQAKRFLAENADNSDDLGWDRSGVTTHDLEIAEQKLAQKSVEMTDPRVLRYLQDHFSAYAETSQGSWDSYIEHGELKAALGDWNNSYGRKHGRVVFNDHILSSNLKRIAGQSNDEFGGEDDIHRRDLGKMLASVPEERQKYW